MTKYRPHGSGIRRNTNRPAALNIAPLMASSCVMLLTILLASQAAQAQQELEKQATWTIPGRAVVRAQIDAFLNTKKLDDATRVKVDALWPAQTGPEADASVLDQLAVTLALVEPGAREVVEFCRSKRDALVPPEFKILHDETQPPLLRNNLRLLYGRWLAQHHFYDEALHQLDGLKAEDVVDPAALLFYQSAGYYRMLDKKACLPVVSKLLENESIIPRRYATVAQLIKSDIAPLKTDSLDEVSRLMDEVRRRLGLHRAGKRVQKQEDEVLAKLDKMIKKLEEQQQQSSSSGSVQSSNPARDSVPMGGKGPGNVDPKHIGNQSGWGNLPPKERQEALQQIGKDLPAHYREVIEEYFRKLAREGGG